VGLLLLLLLLLHCFLFIIFVFLISVCMYVTFYINADFVIIGHYVPDCWLEVSIRKVLRPATSTQFLLGFPMSTSEC
jgi:hypothetical protein